MKQCPFMKDGRCIKNECAMWVSEEEDCSLRLTPRYLGELLGEILRMEIFQQKKKAKGLR